jgi:hypothetical protein
MRDDSKLAIALRYAASGHKLIPLHHIVGEKCTCKDGAECDSKGKHPRFSQTQSSADPEIISGWLQRWPECNLGMTLAELVVVDVDPRNHGDATVAKLIAENGEFEDTWHQRTGGGGEHFVFKARAGARYQGVLGPGVDLKHGGNSLIVVEPSIHLSGNRYSWLDEAGPFEGGRLAEAPVWLSQPSSAEDLPDPAADKIGAGQRNHFLYERARRLRDLSFTQSEILAALLELNKRCDPRLSAGEVRTISKSAAQNDPEPKAEKESRDAPILGIDVVDFMSAFVVPDWRIKGILQRGNVYSLTAPTNHGKTAIILRIGLCVAMGIPFAALRATQGNVLMLCGENPDDVRGRLIALCAEMGIDRERLRGRLTVIDKAFPLVQRYEEVKAVAKMMGSVDLVIVDTNSAYYGYNDEQDNIMAKLQAQDLRMLSSFEGRPTVVAPYHPTKEAKRDNLIPRGGSGFLAEIDTNLCCWKDENTGIVELHYQRKIRGPSFQPLEFELLSRNVADFKQQDGEPVETVVAVPVEQARASDLKRKQGQDDIAILHEMLTDTSQPTIARALGWFLASGEPDKKKVWRRLTVLAEKGYVQASLSGFELTRRGRADAEKTQRSTR